MEPRVGGALLGELGDDGARGKPDGTHDLDGACEQPFTLLHLDDDALPVVADRRGDAHVREAAAPVPLADARVDETEILIEWSPAVARDQEARTANESVDDVLVRVGLHAAELDPRDVTERPDASGLLLRARADGRDGEEQEKEREERARSHGVPRWMRSRAARSPYRDKARRTPPPRTHIGSPRSVSRCFADQSTVSEPAS